MFTAIKALFRTLWAGVNFIRNLVMNLVFVFFVFLCLAIFSGVQEFSRFQQKDSVQNLDGALFIKFNGDVNDSRDESADLRRLFTQSLSSQEISENYSLFDLSYAIRQGEKDENITGLVLDLTHLGKIDLPSVHYLGKAIRDFKKAGKPVWAYAQNYHQKGYLLASFADEIYLNPMGDVGIHGFGVENLYFKPLFDKLAITPHIFRVGTHKAAVEPFMREDMSPEAKENAACWLSLNWESYRFSVAHNRQIKEEQVLPPAETYLKDLTRLKGDMSAYIKERQLVTDFINELSFNQKLAQRFGTNGEDKPKLVKLNDYLEAQPDALTTNKKQKIAVVNVEGQIVDGEGDEGEAGGDTIVKLLQKAYFDEEIKGVILRINSPGGSAFASERIRQTLVQLQEKGKPVVASMGGLAASGGYWIASTADYIVAHPNTLTGSIGIFAMIPTVEKSLAKIGVQSDGVATNQLASNPVLSGMTEVQGQIIQQQINHGYDKFLTLVSEGRGMKKAEVDKIAQGKVWLGVDAFDYHLVDALGDFDLAVEMMFHALKNTPAPIIEENLSVPAASEEDYGIEWLTDEENTPWTSVMKNLKKQGKTTLLKTLGQSFGVAEIEKVAEPFFRFNDPKGQYLYCLTCGE